MTSKSDVIYCIIFCAEPLLRNIINMRFDIKISRIMQKINFLVNFSADSNSRLIGIRSVMSETKPDDG